MKKMYEAIRIFPDGYESFYGYFPTVEAGQKMFAGEQEEDFGNAKECHLVFNEIELPVKLKAFEHRYEAGSIYTNDGTDVDWLNHTRHNSWCIFEGIDVIDFYYDEREHWDINHNNVVIDVTAEEAKQMVEDYEQAEKEAKRHSVDEYLDSPFAKEWLGKMQYTERVDEFGHKFLFLAILCGYEKLSDDDFQQLCNAICTRAYGDDLRMTMWIGGKVNWTMFYERPDHVNGHETYFCGVVAEDDFGPEDWDKDHSAYSFVNAERY